MCAHALSDLLLITTGRVNSLYQNVERNIFRNYVCVSVYLVIYTLYVRTYTFILYIYIYIYMSVIIGSHLLILAWFGKKHAVWSQQ